MTSINRTNCNLKKKLPWDEPKDRLLRPKDHEGASPASEDFRIAPIRIVWVTGSTIVLFSLMGVLFLGAASSSWVNVVARFHTVEFFNTIVYSHKSPTSDLVSYELWVDRNSGSRLQWKDWTLYGNSKEFIKAYHGKTRQVVSNFPNDVPLVHQLRNVQSLSLETLILTIGDYGFMAPPQENTQIGLNDDLIVFDIFFEDSACQARLWALRNSQLPIRIRYYPSYSTEGIDVLFFYPEPQSKGFFNPNTFVENSADFL